MIIPVSELFASAKMQCSCKDTSEAKQFFDSNDTALIIDVREADEAEQISLSVSVNIPRGMLELKITEYCDQHDMPILVHCAAGGRAALSASTLQMMGYSNVHVIDAKVEDIIAAFE